MRHHWNQGKKDLKAFLIEEEMLSLCLAFLSRNINNKTRVRFLLRIWGTCDRRGSYHLSNSQTVIFSFIELKVHSSQLENCRWILTNTVLFQSAIMNLNLFISKHFHVSLNQESTTHSLAFSFHYFSQY